MTTIFLFEGNSLLSNSISGLCLLKSLPAKKGFAVVTALQLHMFSYKLIRLLSTFRQEPTAMMNKKRKSNKPLGFSRCRRREN